MTQVAWVGRDELLVKYVDRTARWERVGLFDLRDGALREGKEGTIVGKVVRETDWEEVDGGWAEPDQHVVGIEAAVLASASYLSSDSPSSSAPVPSYPSGYLDILPNSAGYNHLAYFSPASSPTPAWLTNGTWEIDGGIARVDVKRGLAYVVAANPSVARHVLAVPLPRSAEELDALRADGEVVEPTRLSGGAKAGKGEDELAHYAVSVSPGGGVYQLNYGALLNLFASDRALRD